MFDQDQDQGSAPVGKSVVVGKGPDGKVYRTTGPLGATAAQHQAAVNQHVQNQKKAATANAPAKPASIPVYPVLPPPSSSLTLLGSTQSPTQFSMPLSAVGSLGTRGSAGKAAHPAVAPKPAASKPAGKPADLPWYQPIKTGVTAAAENLLNNLPSLITHLELQTINPGLWPAGSSDEQASAPQIPEADLNPFQRWWKHLDEASNAPQPEDMFIGRGGIASYGRGLDTFGAATAPVTNSARNYAQGVITPGLARASHMTPHENVGANVWDFTRALLTDIPGNIDSGLRAVIYNNGDEMIGKYAPSLAPGTTAGNLYNTLTALGSDPMNILGASSGFEVPGIRDLTEAARRGGVPGVVDTFEQAAAKAGPSVLERGAAQAEAAAARTGQAAKKAALITRTRIAEAQGKVPLLDGSGKLQGFVRGGVVDSTGRSASASASAPGMMLEPAQVPMSGDVSFVRTPTFARRSPEVQRFLELAKPENAPQITKFTDGPQWLLGSENWLSDPAHESPDTNGIPHLTGDQEALEAQIEEQAKTDLSALVEPVEFELGRKSRWNKKVIVDGSMGDALAKFGADGTILISPKLYLSDGNFNLSDGRWRTLIHELVHSVAVPTGKKYDDHMGWEEAPVEILQRAIRARVMKRAGISYNEDAITPLEKTWFYEEYINHARALETILGINDPFSFYKEMIGMPIDARPAYVMKKYYDNPDKNYNDLTEVSSLSKRLKDNKKLENMMKTGS